MKKFFNNFKYAVIGIHTAIQAERNMRIHISIAFYVVAAAILGQVTLTEWFVLLMCISVVLTAEMFNTAIERTCDRISRDRETEIGIIKDIAAGAVLITAIFSAFIGIIIFFRKKVLMTILTNLFTMPAVVIIILTIPIVLYFILKKNK